MSDSGYIRHVKHRLLSSSPGNVSGTDCIHKQESLHSSQIMMEDEGDTIYLDIPCIHVEVAQLGSSTVPSGLITRMVDSFLRSNYISLPLMSQIKSSSFSGHPFLQQHIENIRICELRNGNPVESHFSLSAKCQFMIHIYKLSEKESELEDFEEDPEASPSSFDCLLPSRQLEPLWETLVFEDDIQWNLLNYVYTSLLFRDSGVDTSIISTSGIILLHGPPGNFVSDMQTTNKTFMMMKSPIGTGKTTLCKALAQKISIRLGDRFHHGKLIEINAHSLFSKFFSESARLVTQLFHEIHAQIHESEDRIFFCILIDEAESLTAARKAASSGVEPTDAIRVVNALLTQIDRLRNKGNVLVLATSNLTEAMDDAFLDRADLTQYIGNPSSKAIYQILASCLMELLRCRIIKPDFKLLSWEEATLFDPPSPTNELLAIARKLHDVSGRTLRRLVFLAHAKHLKTKLANIQEFMKALNLVSNEAMGRVNNIGKMKPSSSSSE